MIDIFNRFDLELSGLKYQIKPSKEGDVWSYSLEHEGKEHIFKCSFAESVVRSVQWINGIDPLTELANILKHELRYELFQLVYKCSLVDLFSKIAECSNDFELFALGQQDSIVAAWLDNFDRKD